jgi:hypothetical protein
MQPGKATTMTKTMLAAFASAVALGTLIQPAPAAAQATFARSAETTARAIELEARAEALYSSPRRYRDAARLHEQAARVRGAADPQSAKNLRQAARLYHYAGDVARARSTMERAADAAMQVGDVVTAAASYLDAAFMARDEGLATEVERLVERARLLGNSPLLDAAQRDAILGRIRVSA